MPSTKHMSQKIWEGPMFSPLAEVRVPHKQEVKAKAELQTAWSNIKVFLAHISNDREKWGFGR